MKKLLLCLLACAVLGAPAASQALEFRLLSWQGEITGLRYDQKGNAVSVSASENGFSGAYTQTDAGPLIFYREVPSEKGAMERKIVATVPLPGADVTRAILVLIPVGGIAEETYTFRWLDDSPALHPVNAVCLYNFSSRELTIRVEDKQWQLASGESHLIPFALTARQLPLRIAEQKAGQWRLAFASVLPVRKDHCFYLLLRDGRPRADGPTPLLDMIFSHDYVPPKPPSAP